MKFLFCFGLWEALADGRAGASVCQLTGSGCKDDQTSKEYLDLSFPIVSAGVGPWASEGLLSFSGLPNTLCRSRLDRGEPQPRQGGGKQTRAQHTVLSRGKPNRSGALNPLLLSQMDSFLSIGSRITCVLTSQPDFTLSHLFHRVLGIILRT